MRQESNHRMSSSKGGNFTISNSRAMGVIILIALLFVFQVVTFVMQNIGGAAQDEGAGSGVAGAEVFMFNPNTVGLDTLQLLGFTPRQAQSVLNYRDKGGKFRVKRDFAKLYVVDSARYAALAPYIALPDSIPAGNVQESVNASTKLSSGRKNVQKMMESDTKISVGKKNVQEKEGDSTKMEAGENVYGNKVERNRYVCNLNRADSAELVRLYGIGGYFAKKILRYRERLGGTFVSPMQLLEIEGFGQERFERIKECVVVLDGEIKGFSLLEAEREALEQHPYVGPYAARGIITYIRIKGKEYFKDNLQLLQELVNEHIITENNALRLREYLLHL